MGAHRGGRAGYDGRVGQVMYYNYLLYLVGWRKIGDTLLPTTVQQILDTHPHENPPLINSHYPSRALNSTPHHTLSTRARKRKPQGRQEKKSLCYIPEREMRGRDRMGGGWIDTMTAWFERPCFCYGLRVLPAIGDEVHMVDVMQL